MSANLKSRGREAVRIVVFGGSIGHNRLVRSRQERRAREGESPVRTRRRVVALAHDESGSLRVESKASGILPITLNIDRRPIAKK
jgi:hypothetical protein